MADPRRTSTRRAVLSYSQLKELTDWPDLLLKDYQGILQDFVFTANEIDGLEDQVEQNSEDIIALDIRVTNNEGDIVDLQDSHYPNIIAQVQFLQQQINGLPEFTIDTSGFTTDTTLITADKVIA